MNSEKFNNQNDAEEGEKLQKDPVEVDRAKKAIQFFRKTYFLAKIYPPENPSVKTALDLFDRELRKYLDEYEELIIEVGEFSFSYKGEVVFQDIEKKKSLPFLFYKDGIRELSFHKGLDEKELQDFFRTLKEVSDLPPEDTDVVSAIWEKGFVYIRHFAVDEYLDSDIKEEREKISPIDRKKFSEGKLSLTPEDEREVITKRHVLSLQPGDEEGEVGDEGGGGDTLAPATQVPAMKKDDLPEIESMLSRSRQTAPLTELITLLFELLFFEEKDEQFSTILGLLDESYQKVMKKGNFARALSILSKIQELKEVVSSKSEERAKLLDRILNRTREASYIDSLKKLYLDGQVEDFDSFFQYLEVLGPSAFPVVATVWEVSRFPFSRQKASNFLKEMGKQDLGALLNLARRSKPSLAKEIINILVETGDRKEISHLDDFINHQNKEIRIEVIQALGKTGDEASNKILIKFLSDKDEEVRTRAAMNLTYVGDKSTLDYVMQVAQQKDFKDRNRLEKKAYLTFLASTKSAEVNDFLRSILKKRSIFTRTKLNETRLCVVSALEAAATREALEILKEGAKIRNKAIRSACKRTLMKVTPKDEPQRIVKEEQDV